MLAHAFLSVTAAAERTRNPTPDGLIALTLNEIRRLFTRLLPNPPPLATHILRWSK